MDLGNATTKRAETLGTVVRECRGLPAQACEAGSRQTEDANWPWTGQTETTAAKAKGSIRTRRSTKSSDTSVAQVGKTSLRISSDNFTDTLVKSVVWVLFRGEHFTLLGKSSAVW